MEVFDAASGDTGDFDFNAAIAEAITEVETGKSQDIDNTSATLPAKTEGKTDNDITDQGDDKAAKPADKEQPLTAPERWSAERKAQFSTLPREAQEILLERESEIDKSFTQKTQEIAEQRKAYEALDKILETRRQGLEQHYGTVDRAIGELFQLSDYANSDPAGFIKWFAQQRGVDLGAFTKQQDSGNDSYIDPEVDSLRKDIETIKQKTAQQEQLAQQARQKAISDEINAFKSEMDESGNAKRPYFDDVKAEMAALIQNNVAKNLQDAYDRAVYANPVIRQKIFEAEKQAAEKARLEEAKKAAAKAAKAEGIKAGSKTPASPGKAAGSWEDTVSESAAAFFS